MLAEKIGEIAMLEQTAEECTELAHACLKLARKMRGENPTNRREEDLKDNLAEEIVDVRICLDEILALDMIAKEDLKEWYVTKKHNITNRCREEKDRDDMIMLTKSTMPKLGSRVAFVTKDGEIHFGKYDYAKYKRKRWFDEVHNTYRTTNVIKYRILKHY